MVKRSRLKATTILLMTSLTVSLLACGKKSEDVTVKTEAVEVAKNGNTVTEGSGEITTKADGKTSEVAADQNSNTTKENTSNADAKAEETAGSNSENNGTQTETSQKGDNQNGSNNTQSSTNYGGAAGNETADNNNNNSNSNSNSNINNENTGDNSYTENTDNGSDEGQTEENNESSDNGSSDSGSSGSERWYYDLSWYGDSNPGGRYTSGLHGCYVNFQYDENLIYERIMNMQNYYPTGMSWTRENEYWNSYVRSAYTWGGCSAFARMVQDAAFGNRPYYRHTDFSQLKVGDVVRYYPGGKGNGSDHEIIIIGFGIERVQGNGFTESLDDYFDKQFVYYAEGNSNDKVRWNAKILASELEEKLDFIESRY